MSSELCCRLTAVAAALGVLAAPAPAQQPSRDTTTPPPAHLDTLVSQGRTTNLVGTASSASEGEVGAADIAARPALRPAEVVENIPGVIVTQHSGSGKANQYFLRGFNLDHGTDLAISVDDVPVNMPSHAHGQGYADLNFLIPELVDHVDFRKGPYYADVGDFGSAGSVDIHYVDRLASPFVVAEGGAVGYGRALVAEQTGNATRNLLGAFEFEHNDGPWDIGDDARKFDGVLRYTLGSMRNGVTVSLEGYRNAWHATDQVPERAILDGLIDRWGAIDSTDAGNTGRYAISADWRHSSGHSTSHAIAYALYYDLDLFSDFTYFLEDPVHGDQIEQQDHRAVFGFETSRAITSTVASAPSVWTFGFDSRTDAIHNGLYHTEDRQRIAATTVNRIVETTAAPYIENRTWWRPWMRTVVGARLDFYAFDVHNVTGGGSGDVTAGLLSPKVSVVLGPWSSTEFYLDAGEGFHSNDARGVVAPADPATPLPRSKGAEFGVRTAAIRGLESSVSLWLLDLASELVWDGDEGGNTPSGPTRRYGVEWSNSWTPTRSITIDADYAWSHTRFTDVEPDGPFVPEALVSTFDGGAALHDVGGPLHRWRAGLRLRYFGPRPLTQDGSVHSNATTLIYADVGRQITSRWDATLSVFNLLDTDASDIDYYYASRLPGEPADGIDDIHTHPAEPREVRLTIRMTLDRTPGRAPR